MAVLLGLLSLAVDRGRPSGGAASAAGQSPQVTSGIPGPASRLSPQVTSTNPALITTLLVDDEMRVFDHLSLIYLTTGLRIARQSSTAEELCAQCCSPDRQLRSLRLPGWGCSAS
ncbi:MAG TPA: hypothetical protein VN961_19105, partial [Streptosporangiaceae bacterium]|nr:hypothetical protein [Streptosporangiaceae bacterium]